MDDYKEHLRRLALHDDALLDITTADGSAFAKSVVDERTETLVRVAATIALDAAPSSFQHAVAHALAAGATSDQIVAALEAVAPVTALRESSSVFRRSHWHSATTSRPCLSGSTPDETPDSCHRYDARRPVFERIFPRKSKPKEERWAHVPVDLYIATYSDPGAAQQDWDDSSNLPATR